MFAVARRRRPPRPTSLEAKTMAADDSPPCSARYLDLPPHEPSNSCCSLDDPPRARLSFAPLPSPPQSPSRPSLCAMTRSSSTTVCARMCCLTTSRPSLPPTSHSSAAPTSNRAYLPLSTAALRPRASLPRILKAVTEVNWTHATFAAPSEAVPHSPPFPPSFGVGLRAAHCNVPPAATNTISPQYNVVAHAYAPNILLSPAAPPLLPPHLARPRARR
ncbi:hypothetical protein FB451DRAFT_1410497 [Mycena latifolia]|nr:hypothetical protein FB451DRAFT_1410497 [Mycena latifolia]